MDNFYVGGYLRKVDNCYRIKMPCQLLFQGENMRYYLYYDKAKKTVYMYPNNYISKISFESPSNRATLAVALSKGCFVDFDRYNKFLLPQNMREIVGLSKTVAIIGAFDHIEIMSKEQYEQISNETNLTDIISDLKK